MNSPVQQVITVLRTAASIAQYQIQSIQQRLVINCLSLKQEQCCGAIHHHQHDTGQTRDVERSNIDLWLLLW